MAGEPDGPSPQPAPALVCGLDLGGTKLLGVVLDPSTDGPPLLEEKVATPSGGPAVVDALVDLTTRLAAQAEAQLGRSVHGVGLGAQGLVDRSGTLRSGPNLPGVVDLDFATALGDRVGLPVTVDNDATCAAWGEHERGAARGCNHSVTVTLGTGIGAGITVKGELLRGAHGFAGEPGHMVVDPDGPLCPCGRRGCWERYASGSGLGRLAHRRSFRLRFLSGCRSSSRLMEFVYPVDSFGADCGETTVNVLLTVKNKRDAEASRSRDHWKISWI